MMLIMAGIAFVWAMFMCFGLPLILYKAACVLIPAPPLVPCDREFESRIHCIIEIGEKQYKASKTIQLSTMYYYNYNGDIIERSTKFIKYELGQKIFSKDLKVFVKDNTEAYPMECYFMNGMSRLMIVNPIESERIFMYRRNFGRKKSA